MKNNNVTNIELEKAVNVCGGSQTELADRLTKYFADRGMERKVTQSHVWNWLFRDFKTPTNMAYAVEVVTDGAARAYRLCPGEFPVPKVAA